MVDIEYINPGTPVAGPYSPGVKVGGFIFVSGQGSSPGATGIKESTLSVLENIKKIVEVAGGKVSDIVKISVFLKDMKDFGKMNRIYRKFFESNGVNEKFPARTTIEVSNLPAQGILIEIDAIVAI